MCCAVLTGPTGDDDLLRRGPAASWGRGQPARIWVQPDSRKAHQHSWHSASRFLVPRGTGQPHKEQDIKDRDANADGRTDANAEDARGPGRSGTRMDMTMKPEGLTSLLTRNLLWEATTRNPDEERRRTRGITTRGERRGEKTNKPRTKTKSPTDKKKKKKTREVQCLPATGKSDQMEKQTKKPNTEKMNTKKTKKKPCRKRHTHQIVPRLGSAPRCRTPRCEEYSSSEEALRRSISSARRSASSTTDAIHRVCAFAESADSRLLYKSICLPLHPLIPL